MLVISITHLEAQVEFSSTTMLIDGEEVNSGAPMACSDVNGDGLDDLVLLDQAEVLYVIYQTEGVESMAPMLIERVSYSRNWCMQVADLDQNGRQDIFVGGSDGLMVYKAQSDLFDYSPSRIVVSDFLTQGSSFADLDRDGDLDLFVCDDNKENFIALNDGDGNFSQVSNFMDFSTNPPSDGSGNYGSVFSDYDRDGDLDLYISKCRLGAEPGDPERTNQFFENTDTGFVRNNNFPNILSNAQSWVADWVDVDNDGDWDLFVANHDVPMELFIQQDDGTFVDEAVLRGVDFEAGVIQLVSGDYDNDGDIDMFVPGNDHIMFLNDGNGFFTDAGFPEGNEQVESATSVDINNDGKLDLYTGFAQLYNMPTTIPDKIYTNTSPDKNYIKFSLRGNQPNRFAIGATIEIFHEGNHQLREIRAGESYGINKSNILHFGLNDLTTIDSAVIYWPSGAVEKYEFLNANITYQITEGVGPAPVLASQIYANKNFICPQDTILLAGPLLAEGYRWNNGAEDRFIAITSPGIYTLEIMRDSQWVTLPSYQITAEPTDRPQVEVDGPLLKCMTEPVSLTSSSAFAYPVTWNDGLSNEDELEVSMTGSYYFTEQRVCGDYLSDTITIENIDISAPEIMNDTVLLSQPANIQSSDGNTVWTRDTSDVDIIFIGESLVIDQLTSDSLFFGALADTTQVATESVGLLAPGVNDNYHNTQLNGGVLFTTYENIVIEDFTVYVRTPGVRQIYITDIDSGIEYYRNDFDMVLNENLLELNIQLPANKNYVVATDEQVNIDNLGFESPDFRRGVNRVEYPIVGSYMEITGSTFNTGQYYYFYDWNVRGEDKICYSYWQPGLAVVDRGSSSQDVEALSDRITVYPNPAHELCRVELGENHPFTSWELIDVNGQLIELGEAGNNHVIELDLHARGLYFIKLENKNGSVVVKKIISH